VTAGWSILTSPFAMLEWGRGLPTLSKSRLVFMFAMQLRLVNSRIIFVSSPFPYPPEWMVEKCPCRCRFRFSLPRNVTNVHLHRMRARTELTKSWVVVLKSREDERRQWRNCCGTGGIEIWLRKMSCYPSSPVYSRRLQPANDDVSRYCTKNAELGGEESPPNLLVQHFCTYTCHHLLRTNRSPIRQQVLSVLSKLVIFADHCVDAAKRSTCVSQ